MTLLPIDTTSGAWRLVMRYVEQRRADMTKECISLGCSAERRAELAARIAELDDLANAPTVTRTTAEFMGQTTQTRMY